MSSASAAPAAAASSAAPAAAAHEVEFDAGNLVYHVNLFLLAAIAAFVLLRLPRFIARFWAPSEWLNGHLLRYTTPTGPAGPRIVHTTHNATSAPGNYAFKHGSSRGAAPSSVESHTMYDPTQQYNEKVMAHSGPASYPPHVGAGASLFAPLMAPLRARVVPGFSVAQLIIVCGWFAVLVYPTLYKSTGPFTDPVRAGWVGTAQLPFVFAFASKNNVLGHFLGMGYEKLNFLHRFISRLTVLAINIHSLGYIYKWLIAETFSEAIARPSNMWGLIGLVCFDVLFLFSTDWCRKNMYNFFLATHIMSFCLLFPAIYLHKIALAPYVWASLAVYGFDYFLRCIKTRFAHATVRLIPELGVVRMEIPTINSGWRAGQHVRIRVLSGAMGYIGWSEVHPFTIASHGNGSEAGMVLLIKKAGDWTEKIYDMAKQTSYRQSVATERGVGQQVSVMIEGPYGGPGLTMFASYSAAVFVCGGSGITFGLSSIEDLIHKDARKQSRVKVIELVWVVQDASALVPLVPQLTSMIMSSTYVPIRISVYYTRAATGKFPFGPETQFHPQLSLSPGRPRINRVLESVIDKTVTLGAGMKDNEKNSGVVVGVCGPVGLADSVAKESSKVDGSRRDQVGGVDLIEETFGW